MKINFQWFDLIYTSQHEYIPYPKHIAENPILFHSINTGVDVTSR